MWKIWAAGLFLMAAVNGRGEECAVRVTVSSAPSVSIGTLSQARRVAQRIFAGIGAELRFEGKSDGCETPIQVVIGKARPDERLDALGTTQLGAASDRQVHLFIDRVNVLGGSSATGALLGHVMAHEIAHVLEGVPRHSKTGVMKAFWERSDLRTVQYSTLRFEEVDQALIHAALEKMAREVPKAGD